MLFTIPTYDFIRDSSFVVFAAVRNPNEIVPWSYEATSFIARDIQLQKISLRYWLTQFPLPHLEAINWLTQYIATCGKGEEVVQVRAKLTT